MPAWTELVFGSCSPVRSVARAGWAADLMVEDCSSASRYLEFCGFAVVRWLVAPVQTGLGMDWLRFRLVISGSVRGLRWLRGWRAGGRSLWCWGILGIPRFCGTGVAAGCVAVGAGADWIGFRCVFSGSVRVSGVFGGRDDCCWLSWYKRILDIPRVCGSSVIGGPLLPVPVED